MTFNALKILTLRQICLYKLTVA